MIGLFKLTHLPGQQIVRLKSFSGRIYQSEEKYTPLGKDFGFTPWLRETSRGCSVSLIGFSQPKPNFIQVNDSLGSTIKRTTRANADVGLSYCYHTKNVLFGSKRKMVYSVWLWT